MPDLSRSLSRSIALPSVHHGVLRGTLRAGDPLRLLESVMTGTRSFTQNKWILDNRMVRASLPLVDVAHFAHAVRSNAEDFESMCLAWVTSIPLSEHLRDMLARLPIRFQTFGDIDEASCWLSLVE